jgi:mannose/fructose/N-acetylgalactosamine-specific phosphotransferase system component IIC
MPPELYQALAAAALLNLDRLALGQNALCRPLVCGLAMGLILGQARLGLCLGLWAEVLWLARPPLGGAIVPNGGLAVSAVLVGICWGLALLGPPVALPGPMAVMGLALVPPLAHLMTLVEPANRAWGIKAHLRLERNMEADRPLNLAGLNLASIAITFLSALALCLFGALLVALLVALATAFFPPAFWLALGRLEPMVPLVCLAFMGMGLRRRRLSVYAASTAILLALMSLGGLPA